MSEPIEYLILTNLQEALQAIAVGAGYYHDVRGSAVKLDPNQDIEALLVEENGSRPFVVIEVRPGTWEYMPAMQLKLTLPWAIHWISETRSDVDADRMQTFMRGVADIEKAVAADITRGGRCRDTRITKAEFDHAFEGSQVWATVEIEMTLFRTYGAP